jgi:hypothetical protein
MAGDKPITAQARAIMDHLSAAYSSAYVALMYVTDPARWADFAAFAEQHAAIQGERGEWTETDRRAMRQDARIIDAIAEAIEVEGGFVPNGKPGEPAD